MNITQAIKNRIEQLCQEKGITQNKMCTLCGITQSTINNIMNRNQKDVSLLTIVRICNGLNMTLEVFNSDIFKQKIEEKY